MELAFVALIAAAEAMLRATSIGLLSAVVISKITLVGCSYNSDVLCEALLIIGYVEREHLHEVYMCVRLLH